MRRGPLDSVAKRFEGIAQLLLPSLKLSHTRNEAALPCLSRVRCACRHIRLHAQLFLCPCSAPFKL